MGNLLLDPPHLVRILEGVGLHHNREGLALVLGVHTGLQPHGDGAAGAHPVDATCGTLDIGRVDVAARHDDDVLDATAHHNVALLGQVAEVAGVVPTVFVLRGQKSAHGHITGSHRLATQFDDADAARRQHVQVLVDNPCLDTRQQGAQRGQMAQVATGGGNGSPQGGQQIGVDLVDNQTGGLDLREGHGQRGFRHAVGGHHRRGLEAERLSGIT
ncbi:Uncharacterised protein [Mycobacteroides abscessus]|nr:Uncharacterised protein [Mycobacteroides abscessus]